MVLQINVDMIRMLEKHDGLLFMGEQIAGLAHAATEATLEEARQLVVEELHLELNCEREEIAERVRASQVVRPQRTFVTGAVYLTPKKIPLRRFSPAQTHAGVVVRKYRAGQTEFYPSAFGPEISRLGRGVFRRTGRSRLPIERLPGVDLTQEPGAVAALKRAEKEVPEILERNTRRLAGQLREAATSGRGLFDRVHVTDFTRAAVNLAGVVSIGNPMRQGTLRRQVARSRGRRR